MESISSTHSQSMVARRTEGF
ncbi:hypothetical protein [Paenibacillus maysiensis]|nr:hypothetical protein [Paenibacillus maysiensis]